MAEDLLKVARKVLDRAAGSPGEVEVYVERSRTTTVKTYGQQVESLTSGEPRGVGVRVIRDGRQGYAYTGELAETAFEDVLERAVANAEAADPDPCAGLAEPGGELPAVPGVWREALGMAPTERKIALALEAERAALSSPEIETVEESVYADSESQVAIVSSRGVEAYGEQTFCYAYLSAHARRGDDVQTAMGFSTGREPDEIDAESAGNEAARRAAALLGAAPAPSARYTVVLDREVAASLVGVVVQALSAEAVQRGRSLFAGKVGQKLAAPQFTLTDDGLHPDGMGSSPFDDEGMPRGRTPLFSDGVLQAYLHNSYTARKQGDGCRSTGNAARGSYRGVPRVSSSNLVLPAGAGGLEDLFERVGEGLYVVSVTGLHSGANPVSGEFSVGAVGHLIEAGRRGRPVREVTIASDILSLLGNVVDRAGDARWIPFGGSVLTPSLAIADVTVSGT
jgi:PmbA protein